ncbi:type II secretion system protein [Burkholderia cenocepacia]|uniref:type II secretion system protein n=1 Tax=Burkholderia cenocepacia TaxID=95486 RepID=UPI0022388F8F|nr:prepilin-type N-terminal cleavage/methylation domain-containing protein [Burkholderia cenocepacia]MCW5156372.1 prepilin-type N-terminal cleavage/methylation domain-containing protein [Burkholderia cenocepacia]
MIKRRIKTKKQKGLFLIEIMVALTLIAILASASMAITGLEISRHQVQNAFAYGNGLTLSGLTYFKQKGTAPMTTTDLGVNAIPGTTYASAQLVNGHYIVTLGDVMNGSQNPVVSKIKLATIDYAPHFDGNGLLFYTCSFSNSYLKSGAYVSQCTLMTPGTAPK